MDRTELIAASALLHAGERTQLALTLLHRAHGNSGQTRLVRAAHALLEIASDYQAAEDYGAITSAEEMLLWLTGKGWMR